jgi:hypothetical protein
MRQNSYTEQARTIAVRKQRAATLLHFADNEIARQLPRLPPDKAEIARSVQEHIRAIRRELTEEPARPLGKDA